MAIYSPQSNPTERTHRDILQYLRTFCAKRPQTWAAQLNHCNFTLNAQCHSRYHTSALNKLFGSDYYIGYSIDRRL